MVDVRLSLLSFICLLKLPLLSSDRKVARSRHVWQGRPSARYGHESLCCCQDHPLNTKVSVRPFPLEYVLRVVFKMLFCTSQRCQQSRDQSLESSSRARSEEHQVCLMVVFCASRTLIDFHSNCIHLIDYFDDRNHICIVTELLSVSVFDFLKGNAYSPFPASHIQSFAKQLLGSVACKLCVD